MRNSGVILAMGLHKTVVISNRGLRQGRFQSAEAQESAFSYFSSRNDQGFDVSLRSYRRYGQ